MFSAFDQSFPSGLLPLVRKAAPEAGHQVELLDSRAAAPQRDPDANLEWLRPYQREAIDRALASERGIIWMGTGGGKGELVCGLGLALRVPWLFVVHRAQLADDIAGRWEARSGMPSGRVGEGSWDVREDDSLVCATFQTLHRGLERRDPRVVELLQRAQGLVVDESHTLAADSFWQVAMATPNARFRIGLSGTPLARGDRRSVLTIAALGPVIYRVRAEKLIEAGVLARPTIRMVEFEHKGSDCPTWQGVYGEEIVRSATRNRLVVECVKRAEKPAFVFVKEVSHGKKLAKQLLQAGVRAEFVWGTHSVDWRKTRVRDLVAGRLDAIVCSVVFQEGIDCPELRSVVVAAGGKSVIAALQRIGRGMRRADGKTTFDVYDIADRPCGCGGGLHSGCIWLARHTRAREHAYAAEGHTTVREQLVL